MSKRSEFPAWVEKYRGPGKTPRKTKNGYVLVKCTSVYDEETHKPKSKQEYLGKITEEDGFIPKVPKAKPVAPKIPEGSVMVEYWLSRFLKKNFGRKTQRSLYNATSSLIDLVIIAYIFGTCDRSNLERSYLTCSHVPELDDYRSKISKNRINTGVKKLTEMVEDALPDAAVRRNIESLLLMTVIPSTGKPKPEVPDEIREMISKAGLKL